MAKPMPVELKSFTAQLEYWTEQLRLFAKVTDVNSTKLNQHTADQEPLPVVLERSKYLAQK